MTFLRRRKPRLEDAIAELAVANYVEPVTFDDRFAQVKDALQGASQREGKEVIIAILSQIGDPLLLREIKWAVQDKMKGDVQ